MILDLILAALTLLSLALTLWQSRVARAFPLHQRRENPISGPAVTLLKPLKGSDAETEACLRSWLVQQYPGSIQVLFGVADADDTAAPIVRKLLQEFPALDAELIASGPAPGANAKVSQLVELQRRAKHEVVVISDADVRVPPDLLAQLVTQLQVPEVGLVNCFYRLANPATPAMHWEAVAVNADFWSQVLQSQSLKPMDFALGAVMATRRKQLAEIGGFEGLADCLADDYQLGNRIARRGHTVTLCPLVVECWSAPMGWGAVWKHQLRWARTIRVCQPVPYFFSILSNATLWPLAWALAQPSVPVIGFACCCCVTRILAALNLERRLNRRPPPLSHALLVPFKDLLQVGIWLLAFTGNRIEWRGHRLRLGRNGMLLRE